MGKKVSTPSKLRNSTTDGKNIKSLNSILVKIDALLGDDGPYTEKITDIAQFLVPEMADWCCIYALSEDGTLDRATIYPTEIANTQSVYDWLQNDLPNDEGDGLLAVLQTKKPLLVPKVNPVRRAAEAGICSYLLVPIASRQHVIGAIAMIFAGSGRHYDAKMLDLAENMAIHLNSYFDRTQLHDESRRLSAELEQRVGEGTVELKDAMVQLKQTEEMLQSLFRISNKLNATLDVESILDTLAQEAIQMVNGESGFAGLRTAAGMTVHKFFQDGVAVPFEQTWALGEGVPGWVLKYKVPYGTSDAENDPLLSHDQPINANVHSIICTPILDTVGEVIGYFDIRNKKGEEGFTINDQEMLLTLAPVASIAIQNALAYQQRLETVDELLESSKQLQELAASLETAREEERRQVARELHDELGQALTAMKFDLAWLSEQLSQKDENLAQKAKDITSQLNMLIKIVRRIATELRPGMLDDLGLAASIEWQVHDFEKRSGIECRLSLTAEELSLNHEQSLAMFRILQEALTNVARYAEAKHVDVQLEKKGELLNLVLHDDGRGIKEEEIKGLHSLGLLGMRERAKYLGGSVEITGVPGEGTTLKVSIPISKAQA